MHIEHNLASLCSLSVKSVVIHPDTQIYSNCLPIAIPLAGGLDIVISFIILSIVTFFPGYLATSLLFKKQLSRVPFFVALPAYFVMGLCMQILVSALAGSHAIGLSVPLGITILSLIGLLVRIIYTSRAEKMRLQRSSHFHLKKFFIGTSWSKNVFAIVLTLFLFAYFVSITIDKEGWPPVGDANMHSTLTSKILNDDTNVQQQPFAPFPAIYPIGFHTFAANFSTLSNIYPGESVYLVATFTMIIFSTLLFTFSYILTNSVWLSLPSAFSALVVHSSGQLERWVGGFLWNGPYPSLFAFTAVILALLLLELNYKQKRSIFTVLPVLTLIILSLLVGYPNFVPHVLIFLLAYLIVRNTVPIKNYLFKFAEAVLFPLLGIHIDLRHKQLPEEITGGSKGEGEMAEQKLTHSQEGVILSADHKVIDTNRFSKIVTIVILVMFVISFVVSGLPSLYYKLISFNLGVFEIRKDFEYIKFQEVWRNFNSDILSSLAITLEITSFALILVINKRIEPVFIAAFLLLSTLLFQQLGFLYPQRTLTFIATLSWPLVAFAISELKPDRMNLYKSKINSDHLIISVFVLLALVIQVPPILSQLQSQPGWYIFNIFPDSYAAAEWLSRNSDADDLILNDRTYSSFYINGFALRNLTHTYMSGWLKTLPADWPSDFEMTSRDLTKIWDSPWNKDVVSDLLKKYHVKYIVLFEDDKFTNWQNWGGDGRVAGTEKPYSNWQYEFVFSSYEFLDLVFKKGDSLVYRVI